MGLRKVTVLPGLSPQADKVLDTLIEVWRTTHLPDFPADQFRDAARELMGHGLAHFVEGPAGFRFDLTDAGRAVFGGMFPGAGDTKQ